MNGLFKGIFDTEAVTSISVTDFLLCITVALSLGAITALSYAYRSRYTKSFAVTLALLPAAVCTVILMVNGNIGTGVAVAGAFSLVRFRSAPGSAKEIVAIFLAMASGLIIGMGYVAYSVLFTLIMCAAFILCNLIGERSRQKDLLYKTVRITVPEDLDYTCAFDDVLAKYTSQYELTSVKTVNMGSMFRLTYDAVMLDGSNEKEMIDELRIRNGNLEISVSRQPSADSGL